MDFETIAAAVDPSFEAVASQGDSYQVECRGEAGLRLALYLHLLARLRNAHGIRVALSLQPGTRRADAALGLRTGPAYTAAGRGVSVLREQSRTLGYFASATETVASAAGAWTVASHLLGRQLDGLTDRQREVVLLSLRRPGAKQAELAARLEISQQVLSRHQRAAGLREIEDALAAFDAYVHALTA